MDFLEDHALCSEKRDYIGNGLLRHVLGLSQFSYSAFHVIQMIPEDSMHDDALIDRPIGAGVLAYASKYVAPRLRN